MKRETAAYYGGKLLIFILSVALLSIAVFYISRLAPGDPLVAYYGERAEKMSPEEKARTMERLKLNEPIHEQYVQWLKLALKGDFGISYKYKTEVLEVISDRIGNTLILGGLGFAFTFALALLLGVVCAWFEDKWLDKLLCKIGTLTSCVPEFWFSLALILVFCVIWRVLPSSNAYSSGHEHDILDRIRHLVLPMTVVVFSHLWYYAYMIRNKLLDETRADYVLLARGKGLSRGHVMFRHCLRNIMPAYISLMAVSVPHILGGTYIVETVFSYPGLGLLSYESARYHDYNMLMALCLMTGILVIFSGVVAQIINERIDPRMKDSQIREAVEVSADEEL